MSTVFATIFHPNLFRQSSGSKLIKKQNGCYKPNHSTRRKKQKKEIIFAKCLQDKTLPQLRKRFALLELSPERKSEKQVYDITLECLRTNVPIPPDNFQDYDLTFLVMDVQGFIVKNASSDVFNKKLIL